MEQQPVVIIACRVMQGIIDSRLGRSVRRIVFLDYGLHRTPRLMAESIQRRIDELEEPCTILIGYGLCGNGLVGLKARQHTLVIPRTDDCIAMFLGSREAYLGEMGATPGTYFLTRGWVESGSEPLSEYGEYCARYGVEKADLIMDAQYRNYRRLCLVAFSEEDLASCRPRALKVAEFCNARWGWRYEERLGSDSLIRRLLDFGDQTGSFDLEAARGGDLVIILPGEEVGQEPFLRT